MYQVQWTSYLEKWWLLEDLGRSPWRSGALALSSGRCDSRALLASAVRVCDRVLDATDTCVVTELPDDDESDDESSTNSGEIGPRDATGAVVVEDSAVFFGIVYLESIAPSYFSLSF